MNVSCEWAIARASSNFNRKRRHSQTASSQFEYLRFGSNALMRSICHPESSQAHFDACIDSFSGILTMMAFNYYSERRREWEGHARHEVYEFKLSIAICMRYISGCSIQLTARESCNVFTSPFCSRNTTRTEAPNRCNQFCEQSIAQVFRWRGWERGRRWRRWRRRSVAPWILNNNCGIYLNRIILRLWMLNKEEADFETNHQQQQQQQ